jgi:hypothetical protein
MANPRIIFMGQDLFALGYVQNIPEITESNGFERGITSSSDLTIEASNIDRSENNSSGPFSIDNPNSFLNGSGWQFSSLKAYDKDDNVFADCIVADITRTYEGGPKAYIKCRDIMFENRKTNIAYTSSDWETPATAAYNLLIQEGFDETEYDATSFQNSISLLEDAACYVKVNFLASDGLSILTALKKLGEYGAADVSMYRNKIRYKHWTPYTGGVSVYFDYSRGDICPRTLPSISTMESTWYNDYSIGYEGDLNVPATDAANGSIGAASRVRFGTQCLPEMRCNSSAVNQIAFKDLASAVKIGETYIKRCHSSLTKIPKILQKISFDVDYTFKRYIDLGTYFKMSFAEEGWNDKVFEVSSIKRMLDKQNIGVEAWEVAV